MKDRNLQKQIPVFGRSVGIRTRGLLDPNQARYQTSPHPDNVKHYSEIFPACQVLQCFFIDCKDELRLLVQ